MKKINTIVCAVLMIAGTQQASAQISLGLNAGMLSTTGNSPNNVNYPGFTISGKYGINDNIRAGLSISTFSKKTTYVAGPFTPGYTVTSRISPITLTGEYLFLTDAFRPYAGLNIGLYTNRVNVNPGSNSSETGVGIAPVIGADYKFNENLFVNLNIRYHLVFENPTSKLFSSEIGIGYQF